MRTKSWIAALALVIPVALQAQDYKLAKTTGTLEIIDVNDVSIEGTSGNEIIFSSRSNDRDHDERAKGLRAVSSLGLEDNTGLGLSVIDKGNTVEVRQLKKMDGPEILIKVPKGIVISYRHSSPHGKGLSIKNLENELKLSTVHNDVSLENVTGPMNVKTVHGDIDVSLSDNPKTPITIGSVHGHVDVSMPATAKVNLKVSTSWGEIFIDPQLKIEIDRKGEMIEYSNDFRGKMNGGGMEIEFSSTHENVYIRKK